MTTREQELCLLALRYYAEARAGTAVVPECIDLIGKMSADYSGTVDEVRHSMGLPVSKIEVVNRKFVSGNSIPVPQVTVKREEWFS